MKVYDFTEVTYRKQAWQQPVKGRPTIASLPMASGGEDMVQISEEAMSRYRHGQVVALEKARIEKSIERLMPEIKEAMEFTGNASSERILGTVDRGSIDAGNDTVVSETADRLLGFLA